MSNDNLSRQKILIGIASYRDPELFSTINDCLVKAKHPDRLVFAIVNQYEPGAARSFEYLADADLRLVQLPYQESRGVGYARRLMTDLWVDEPWVLQLDAHTRFDQDWDEILLQEWQACSDPKAILTNYLMSYEYDDNGAERKHSNRQPVMLDLVVRPSMGRTPIFSPGTRAVPSGDHPIPTICFSGHFQFGPGDSFGVPYIRELTFWGEEIVRAFQLFSFGYNLYVPRRAPMHHLYKRNKMRFWEHATNSTRQDTIDHLQEVGRKFMNDWLDEQLSPSQASYFGSERNLADFTSFGQQHGLDLPHALANPISL